jgi:predicted enzyme related to lactoylglutathione lyase
VTVPDYRNTDPFVLHIAFGVPDVATARDRLVAAGATTVGDVQISPAGDHLAMLRDPWGLAIQLVRRETPMI